MPRLLLSALLIGWSCFCLAAEVLEVRVWPLLDRSRVEIAVAGDLDHKVFTVEGPDRLVVDLGAARWADGLAQPAVSTRELTGLRWGVREGSNLRLVFDLTGPVRTETNVVGVKSESGRGHWLVLEVFPRATNALPWPLRSAAPARQPAPRLAVEPGPRPSPALTVDPSPRKPVAAPASRGSSARKAPSGPAAPSVQPVAVERAVAPVRPRSSPGAPRKAREVVIAIDAGHGGVDPGAAGRHGTREKDVTLAIARELGRLVDAEPGMRAVLVRDRDTFIPLRQRMTIAREREADLFLSIHADAFHQRTVHGSSVYVLSQRGASSEQARLLAERENAVDLLGGVSLDHPDPMVRSVLLDLAQTGTLEASERVASELLKALGAVGKVHRKDVQHAGFAVLKSPDVPSVLVETAFISNPDEEKRLADRKHQQRLAKALLAGIKRYFSRNAPADTLIAQQGTP
jgi:N-acetylmuramoyl-L-alanine amidase